MQYDGDGTGTSCLARSFVCRYASGLRDCLFPSPELLLQGQLAVFNRPKVCIPKHVDGNVFHISLAVQEPPPPPPIQFSIGTLTKTVVCKAKEHGKHKN